MPALTDKIHFYLLGLLISVSYVLLSFPAGALKATAALFVLWGAYGALRFKVLERAAAQDRQQVETSALPQKLIQTLHLQKQKFGRENALLFLSSGSFWVVCIFLIALIAIISAHIFSHENMLRTDWPFLLRDVSFLWACAAATLGILSFSKFEEFDLKLMAIWNCIWCAIALLFVLRFSSQETLAAFIFMACALFSCLRAIKVKRGSLRRFS